MLLATGWRQRASCGLRWAARLKQLNHVWTNHGPGPCGSLSCYIVPPILEDVLLIVSHKIAAFHNFFSVSEWYHSRAKCCRAQRHRYCCYFVFGDFHCHWFCYNDKSESFNWHESYIFICFLRIFDVLLLRLGGSPKHSISALSLQVAAAAAPEAPGTGFWEGGPPLLQDGFNPDRDMPHGGYWCS